MGIIRKILDYLKTQEGVVFNRTSTLDNKQYRMYLRYGLRVFIRKNTLIIGLGHSTVCPRLERKFGVKFQRVYINDIDFYILQV